MTKFILKDGSFVVVKSFMQGPELSEGYCWTDPTELGSDERIWREVVKPYETDGTLFGYDQDAFLARQYK